MDTEYLKQFALLARECHFQTAADLLYISQSTLSKHIASLEKELGQPLFYRTTRQVELTDFGRRFLPYADKIIGVVHACETELIAPFREQNPSLSVGVSPFASIRRLMEAKQACQTEFPETADLVFTETSSSQLRKGLKTGHYQVVIDGIGPHWEQPDFAAVPYMRDHLCVLLHEGQPLSQRSSLSLHELEALPYIHLYTETDISPMLPDPFLTLDTVPQTLRAVEEGKGFSILPFERVIKHLPSHVRAIRLTPSPELRFNAYYLRMTPRSDALSALLKYLSKPS